MQKAWKIARTAIAAIPPGELLVRRDGRGSAPISIYLPAPMLAEMEEQGQRLDCSLSSLVFAAWSEARPAIAEFPSVND